MVRSRRWWTPLHDLACARVVRGAVRRLAASLGTDDCPEFQGERTAECGDPVQQRNGEAPADRRLVDRLEAMSDEARLPSGDELIGEIERFLRDRDTGAD